MTAIELKSKLKHIGGLCFALAIDINANLTKEQELTEQVKILQAQLTFITSSPEYKKAKMNQSKHRSLARARASNSGSVEK